MSDIQETQNKPLIILRNAEDYPKWRFHITSKLQQQNCKWAITKREILNLKSVKANLILDRFAQADFRPSTLISALKDEKKNYFSGLGKAISTIKNHMAHLLHLFLKERTAPEMWSILKSCFWYISSMSISAVFLDGCTKKSAEFKNIVDYTSSYQATHNKIASPVQPESRIWIETVELFLQANMV